MEAAMALADSHKDFATSLIVSGTALASSSGTGVTVTTGEGALFPAVPFDAVIHSASVVPTSATAEKVRVTGISTDALTIVRNQGGTNLSTIAAGWRITAAIFADHIPKPQTAASIIASQVFS